MRGFQILLRLGVTTYDFALDRYKTLAYIQIHQNIQILAMVWQVREWTGGLLGERGRQIQPCPPSLARPIQGRARETTPPPPPPPHMICSTGVLQSPAHGEKVWSNSIGRLVLHSQQMWSHCGYAMNKTTCPQQSNPLTGPRF